MSASDREKAKAEFVKQLDILGLVDDVVPLAILIVRLFVEYDCLFCVAICSATVPKVAAAALSVRLHVLV